MQEREKQSRGFKQWITRTWQKRHLMPLLFEKVLRETRKITRPGRARQQSTELPQFCNVGEGTHEHGRKSYLPDAATTLRYLFYEQGVTSNDYCKLAAGTNEPLGPSDDLADTNALDVPITVKLLGGFAGTTRAVSDGTVTNNTRICVSKDGTGRATCPAPSAGTYWVVGKAIVPTDDDGGGTVAAGDNFEFVPCFPVQKTY